MAAKGTKVSAAAIPTGPTPEEARLRLDYTIHEVADANLKLKEVFVAALDTASASRVEVARVQAESLEYSTYAVHEIKTLTAEVASLKARLQTASESSAAAAATAAFEFKTERETLTWEASRRENELKREITDIKTRLQGLSNIAEQKHIDDTRIAELEAAVKAERVSATLAFGELERKYISEKISAGRNLEMMRKAEREFAETKALSNVAGAHARILSENKAMSIELIGASTESRLAATRYGSVMESKAILERKAADLQEETVAWGLRCGEQLKVMKERAAKIVSLETTLNQTIENAATAAATALARFVKESEAARTEIAGLRELITLKNLELKTVKRLASNVLSQRTDVEQFFIDALADAKLDVLRRRNLNNATTATATGGGGGVIGGSARGHRSSSASSSYSSTAGGGGVRAISAALTQRSHIISATAMAAAAPPPTRIFTIPLSTLTRSSAMLRKNTTSSTTATTTISSGGGGGNGSSSSSSSVGLPMENHHRAGGGGNGSTSFTIGGIATSALLEKQQNIHHAQNDDDDDETTRVVAVKKPIQARDILISELSPEDRETLLRTLFAHVNGISTTTNSHQHHFQGIGRAAAAEKDSRRRQINDEDEGTATAPIPTIPVLKISTPFGVGLEM